MKQSGRFFTMLAAVAGAAIMSTTAVAGDRDNSGAARPESPHRATAHVKPGGTAEANASGVHAREAAERERGGDSAEASRNPNGAAASPATASPFVKIGSAPASTLKTVPLSALGSRVVTVPLSSMSTMTPSTIAATPSPAPVTATPPPAPTIDGAALYNSLCAGCHGNSKRNRPAASIQAAISGNVGGMGSLSYLTPAQLQAISAY